MPSAGTHEGTQGQAPGHGTGSARGSPSPLSRGHTGQCSQCSCSHPILSEGLQRGGHPERHRPWGRDPAAPPARTQPERGPGSAARARLRLHRAPLLLLLLFPPSPEGDPGVRPRPHAPAAARGPAGPGVRGMGPPGGPAAASVSADPGMRWRGEERSRGDWGEVPLPAAAARQEGSGVHPQPPRACSARCGTPGAYGPRSPLREPERGATPRRSRPREGKGCRGEPPREDPAPPAPWPAPLRGAHAAARNCPGEGGTRRVPTLRQDPRAGEPPPNRFHRGLPAPHGGPSPLSAPAEPRGSPVPSGVRRGEAQPCLTVRLRCRCRWQPRAGGSRLKVAVPG